MDWREIAFLILLFILLVVLIVLYATKKTKKTTITGQTTGPDSAQVLTEEEKSSMHTLLGRAKAFLEHAVEYEAISRGLRVFFGRKQLDKEDKELLTHFRKALGKVSKQRPGKAFHATSHWAEKNLMKRSVFNRFRSLYNRGAVEMDELLKHGIKSKKTLEKKLKKEGKELSAEAGDKFAAESIQDAAKKMGIEMEEAEAERLAAKAELMVAEGADPLAWFLDIGMIGGMILDHYDPGGWLKNMSTVQWMDYKKKYDTDAAKSYIGSNHELGAYWPEIVGPMSVMAIRGDLETQIDGAIFDILLEAEHNPEQANDFMTMLMTEVLMNFDDDQTIEENFYGAFDAIPSEYYDTLYDMAYDDVCENNDGVIIRPGEPFMKQCSYISEEKCHEATPWTPTVGLQEADALYTEWRPKKYFDNTPIYISHPATGKSEEHHYKNIPPLGACTLQSPNMHIACNTPVSVQPWFGLGKKATVYYTYDRTSGQCSTNSTFCDVLGLGKQNKEIEDTITGTKLHECEQGWIGKIASTVVENIIGLNPAQQAASCLSTGGCCPTGGNDCLRVYNAADPTKNEGMIVVPT
jgi:hypothetical protein